MKHIRNAVIPALILGSSIMAQDLPPIELPAPDTTGGKPLMQVLHDRHTTREFAADTLPLPLLSNLLWAAGGINRPESGKRTAPSAMNWQEIDIYVVRADGVHRYDPKAHTLVPVLTGDIRGQTGMQPFVKDAPINLIFVADFTRMGDPAANDDERRSKERYAAADAAFMCQNVYLFCASEGLATVVRGSVDREALGKTLNLPETQQVVFAQTVGYPKK